MITEIIDEKIMNARRFASKCISDKLKDLNPNEYYILQISKFILLKEKLIKKDRKSNLHFDYDCYHEYVPTIKEIGDTLIKNATKLQIKNVLNVIIEPEKYNNDLELKYYILLIHKLRDCLAHGTYDVDFKKRVILINNDTNDMDLITYIPMDLIEKFTYIKMPTRISHYKKIDYKGLDIGNKDNIYFNNYKYNNIDNNQYIYNRKDNIEYISPDIERRSNKYKIEELEVLRSLIVYANSIGLPHEFLDSIAKQVKQTGIQEEFGKRIPIVFTIKSLVDEISSIIGIKTKSANPYAFVATYNYMQIYLSNKYHELWNKRPEILSHLRLSKINPIFSPNPDSYKLINDTIRNIIKRTRKAIEKYKFVSNITYKEKILNDINTSFKNNIGSILKILGNRNMDIITGIRNSIEHGNFMDFDGEVVLYDKDDQNDDESVNFISMGSCKDYFELIETLDLKLLTPLTNNELLEELKGMVSKDLLDEFRLLIEEINELNNNKYI